MARLIYTLSACADCLMLVANGESSEDRPDIEREIIENLQLRTGQHLVCSGDGEQDSEFSWSPCECCGSRLGGSRHELAILDTGEGI